MNMHQYDLVPRVRLKIDSNFESDNNQIDVLMAARSIRVAKCSGVA